MRPMSGFARPDIARRRTRTVHVGGIPIGSGHPIVVQSMTNTDTADVAATVAQVRALADAGSELVRITVNTLKAAQAVPAVAKARTVAIRKPRVMKGRLASRNPVLGPASR